MHHGHQPLIAPIVNPRTMYFWVREIKMIAGITAITAEVDSLFQSS
jgi:hypothetical protein